MFFNATNERITANLSNTTTVFQTSSEHHQVLVWFVTEMLFCGVGILANLLLILAIILHKPLRRSSSALLIGHCVAIDLYTCAVVIPFNAIAVLLGPDHPPSNNLCRFEPLWVFMIYPAEAWAALAVAVHRLAATFSPMHFAKFKTRPALACLLASPWVVAYSMLSLTVIPSSKSGISMIPAENGGCRFAITRPVTAIVTTIINTYGPVTATGVCYSIFLVKTLFDLRRRGDVSPALRRRREISRMLMLSFVWHCVTLVPGVVVATAFSAAYGRNLALRLGSKWFLDCFSDLNPIFCLAASSLLQEGVRDVLRCGWYRGNPDGGRGMVHPLALSSNATESKQINTATIIAVSV